MNEKEWMEYCISLQSNPVLEEKYKELALQGKVGVASPRGGGNIPILFANGKGLAEAWENSLIALWCKGGFIRTQYDQKSSESEYIHAPSKDATMILVVEEPLSEPMIHRCFPGGTADLEEYRQEVIDGIKDNWVRDPKNPEDMRWEYTYHERIFTYRVPGLEKSIDQFEAMAKNLAKSPITRRAQVVSWKVWEDIDISDPACFQSLWGRILRQYTKDGTSPFYFYSDEATGTPKLNFNMRFRSRDAFLAAFMNDFAFVHLGKKMADRVSELRGEKVTLGRFLDMSDSYHIYGRDFKDFLGRFVKGLGRPFYIKDDFGRTFRTDDKRVLVEFEEARKKIPEKVAAQNAKYAKGEGLTKDSTKL